MSRTPQDELVFRMCRQVRAAPRRSAACGLLAGRPVRDTASAARRSGQPGRVEVADDHVVEQDVVQAPGRQPAADEVGVDVEDRRPRPGPPRSLVRRVVAGHDRAVPPGRPRPRRDGDAGLAAGLRRLKRGGGRGEPDALGQGSPRASAAA